MTQRKLNKLYFLTFLSSQYLPSLLSLPYKLIILRVNQFLVNSNKLFMGKTILRHKI